MNRNEFYSIYIIKNNKGKKIFNKKDTTIILPTIQTYYEVKYNLNRYEEIYEIDLLDEDEVVLNFFEEYIYKIEEKDLLIHLLKKINEDIYDDIFNDAMNNLISALENLKKEECDKFIFKQTSANNNVAEMFTNGSMIIIDSIYEFYNANNDYIIKNVQ